MSKVRREFPTLDIGLWTSFGGQGRNRTADAGLFRAALYRLSYLAWIFEASSGKSAV